MVGLNPWLLGVKPLFRSEEHPPPCCARTVAREVPRQGVPETVFSPDRRDATQFAAPSPYFFTLNLSDFRPRRLFEGFSSCLEGHKEVIAWTNADADMHAEQGTYGRRQHHVWLVFLTSVLMAHVMQPVSFIAQTVNMPRGVYCELLFPLGYPATECEGSRSLFRLSE